MSDVKYDNGEGLSPDELSAFYAGVGHEIAARPEQIRRMMDNAAIFVTARVDGRVIGVARGVSDGVRGYLTECKLEPAYQGPAAVTRRDGRIEHDTNGIALEMARRVLRKLHADGIQRVDVVAWGTEVDFLEDLGFKRRGGLVGLTMPSEKLAAMAADTSAK